MNGHEVSSSFWNEVGLIPPVKNNPIGRDRSPYRMPLSDFVDAFGVSKPRRRLLADLLDLRAALHAARLVKGFQWINGSFAEHVEMSQNRTPNDIDVVTFYYMPSSYDTQKTLFEENPTLFDDRWGQFDSVHSHFVSLDETQIDAFVQLISYWYSLWSHTREGTWKGFIEVDLAPEEDVNARQKLNETNDTEDYQP